MRMPIVIYAASGRVISVFASAMPLIVVVPSPSGRTTCLGMDQIGYKRALMAQKKE